jgi:hypothetical protein
MSINHVVDVRMPGGIYVKLLDQSRLPPMWGVGESLARPVQRKWISRLGRSAVWRLSRDRTYDLRPLQGLW